MSTTSQSTHSVEELRAERLAALNLMEDAIVARGETERANAALRESEMRLRNLLHTMDEAFVVHEKMTDGDGRIVDWKYVEWNPAFTRHMGIANPENKTLRQLIPEIEPVWINRCADVLRTGEPIRFQDRIAALDRWLDVFVSRVGGPESGRVALLFTDITQRRHTENALRANEEQFRRAIEDAPIPIIMHAEDGTVLQISRTWTELTGYAMEDMPTIDKWLNQAYGDGAESVRAHMHQLFSDPQRTIDVELPVRTRDGTVRHWSFSASSPGRLHDHRRFIVGMAVDITDRKHAAEFLTRSQAELQAAFVEMQHAREEAEVANRTKDRFLAILSHELRTPLTPVLGAAESMLRQKDLSPRTREGLEMICRNVELQMHLINDLLDVTRISRGTLELDRRIVCLHEVVKTAVEITLPDIEAKQQKLSVKLNAKHHAVNADAARTQQVLWNLLKNASKFTPDNGEIRVTSRNEPGSIIVEISDTGIGIEAHAFPTIFEVFRQAETSIAQRFGGLGLGLAISKATVDAHGGNIEVYSAGPGKGATFRVKLPLEEQ